MKIAKSRAWTEAEVQEAVAAIKREAGLWQELEHVEITTADIRQTELFRREMTILRRLHPDPELGLHEMTGLYGVVRDFRRARLGLK
jgi:hypothetical protein